MFAFFAGVLSDPNDQQGSTKRLCLFLFLTAVMLLIILVTLHDMRLPVIPDSLLSLVYFVIGTLTGGVVADKAIAAYKTVKGAVDVANP